MNYFSMFSGIGGFELGIKQSGIKNRCVGFSEINKYAIQIYTNQFKEHKNYEDCARINWKEIEEFDCLVAGFPCQAFSIAGLRKGFKDPRGTMFFEIARCLGEKQPRICVLENVKGLLSHDGGNTFFTILATLDELGYDCEWQVLNSKNFGLPQNRERVFVIGHLRGREGGRKIFPIGGQNKKRLLEVGKIEGIHGLECVKRLFSFEGLSPTITIPGGGYRFGKFFDGKRIRRLTPLECERAQGFPDRWTLGISEMQRYRCIGNAVSVCVVKELFKKIMKELFS